MQVHKKFIKLYKKYVENEEELPQENIKTKIIFSYLDKKVLPQKYLQLVLLL